MVAEILKQDPYWTAMRCRVLFCEPREDTIVLDAIMSEDQPDNAAWKTSPGSPFSAVVAVPSRGWLVAVRATLDTWVAEQREVELRRTRAWEDGSQVLLWEPDSSLLVTLTA